MKIHHLDCGTMCPRALPRLVCHCLLVEAPRGLVLIGRPTHLIVQCPIMPSHLTEQRPKSPHHIQRHLLRNQHRKTSE